MSTYWDIYCETCNEKHGFFNANHAEVSLSRIIKHAKILGTLSDVVRDNDIEITTPFGNVDTQWFKEHSEHCIVVRNEYGENYKGER